MREGATGSWPPLRIIDGALHFGGGRARFTPDGLAIRPVHRKPRTLPWERVLRRGPMGRGGWSFDHTRSWDWSLPRYQIRGEGRLLLDVCLWERIVRVDAAWSLAEYLRDVPAARSGLADPLRVTALLRALKAGHWAFTRLPREPLGAEAYDLHWAVLRAIDRAGPRRYEGRPVARDVLDVEHVVALVRAEQGDRFGTDRIETQVRRYLDVTPWPFSVLLDATNGPAPR